MSSPMNGDHDQRNHDGMEDLTTMTIESLRARLLSERAISRTARQRADELSKRVVELEEQLRIVSLQRKKAEMATADVLAILESNGISDASEEFDSSSDREMSVCESKLSSESVKRKEASTNFQERRNDEGSCSSSEIDSSSTAGSLSWKSNKDSPNYLERKKYIDSIRRRSSSFASSGSLPKRVGKSCRRIRRKDIRARTEELYNGDNVHGIHDNKVGENHQDLPHFPDTSIVSRKEPENHEVKESMETSVSGVSGTPETGVGTANLSTRSEHDLEVTGQAQKTVGSEREEKAKTEWEDKFKENNSYVSDSGDPGNRSDVTEDRDEIRLPDQSFTSGVLNRPQESQILAVETGFSFKPEVPNNLPETPQFNSGQTQDQKNGAMSTLESSSSDFAFSSSVEIHGQVLTKSNDSRPPDRSHMHSQLTHASPSSETNVESSGKITELAKMPEKSSGNLDSVLDALQLAKLSLQQKLYAKSVSEDESSVKDSEPSFPVAKTGTVMEMPAGYVPGLFRLPVEFPVQKPSTGNSLSTDPTLRLSNNYLEYARETSISNPRWEPRSHASPGDIYCTTTSISYADIPSINRTLPPSITGRGYGVHTSASSSGARSGTYTYTPQPMEGGSLTYTGIPPPIQLNSGIPMEGGSLTYTGIPPPIQLNSGIPLSRSSSSLSTRNPEFAPGLDGARLFPTARSTYMDSHANMGYPISRYTYQSYPSSPDVSPQLQLSDRFSRDVRGMEFGVPPTTRLSSYSDHTRPNLYK